jgi:hypothetical protein
MKHKNRMKTDKVVKKKLVRQKIIPTITMFSFKKLWLENYGKYG